MERGIAAQRREDALLLGGLLAGIGLLAAPESGEVETEGVHFFLSRCRRTLAPELRASRPCPDCGDPVHSEPIGSLRDVVRWCSGGHRAGHEHGWMNGG